MTASRKLRLAASHLLVLGLSFGFAHNLKPETEPRVKEVPLRTRSSNRSAVASTGDGPELLAEFRKDFSQKKSRYEELKESLQPAADLQAAAISAIEAWKNEMPEQDRVEAFAMMEARFFHWLRANPREAMQYFSNAEKGIDAMKQSEFIQQVRLFVRFLIAPLIVHSTSQAFCQVPNCASDHSTARSLTLNHLKIFRSFLAPA